MLPLIIVTRPAAQAGPWVDALRAAGVPAAALPLIGIAPPTDAAPVLACWQALRAGDLVMFVSANAVQHFVALRPAGAVWPAGVRAGSTGPGTSAALRDAGLGPRVEPDPTGGQFDTEALWRVLQHEPWAGRRVWVVRGEQGRDWFADTLRAAGAELHFVPAYRRLPPQLQGAEQALLAQALAAPAAHRWLFSSSEAVARLGELAPGAGWHTSHAAASHPRIAEAARQLGFGRVDTLPPDPAAVAAWARAVDQAP